MGNFEAFYDKLELIKSKIIEANPEFAIRVPCSWSFPNECSCDGKGHSGPMRIGDVLLAFERFKPTVMITAYGLMTYGNHRKIGKWDLRRECLSEQSIETIDFIYSVLLNSK